MKIKNRFGGSMKTGIILLARLSSSRLPGKVLMCLCGKPVLEHIILRLKNVKLSKKLIVATTVNKVDDAIEALCRRIGVSCFRGNQDNILERCIQASDAHDLDVIVRVGADTPFIDWEIIDDMLRIFFEEWEKGNHLEYMSNNMERSFPLGLDADVFHKETFLRLVEEIKNLSEKQRKLNENNVIPFVHENLNCFRTYSFKEDYDYSHLRWTLDTPEDFELTTRIYEVLYPNNPHFLMQDILDLLSKHPDWSKINSGVIPVTGYWTETEKNKLHRRLKT